MHNDSAESIQTADASELRVHFVDGYGQDNVTASQTNVELSRTGGRFKSSRPGSVTSVMAMLEAGQARTAGTLTVEVFIASVNATTGVRTETATGLTAILDANNPAFKITAQSLGLDEFVAGSEIYPKVTTDGSWAPTTADLKVVITVET